MQDFRLLTLQALKAPKEETDTATIVEVFFNCVEDEYFVSTIRDLVHKVGVSPRDGVGCDFSAEREPGEEPYQGVKFWMSYPNAEGVINYSSCLNRVHLACRKYTIRHPEDRFIIEQILRHSEIG